MAGFAFMQHYGRLWQREVYDCRLIPRSQADNQVTVLAHKKLQSHCCRLTSEIIYKGQSLFLVEESFLNGFSSNRKGKNINWPPISRSSAEKLRHWVVGQVILQPCGNLHICKYIYQGLDWRTVPFPSCTCWGGSQIISVYVVKMSTSVL